MERLIDWITEEAAGETVLNVTIGKMGWGDFKSEGVPNYEECPKGKMLSWEEAKPWLMYEFDSDYGAPRCQALYAWTENKVIAIGQYDGMTWAYGIPRNPCDCMPEMQGG